MLYQFAQITDGRFFQFALAGINHGFERRIINTGLLDEWQRHCHGMPAWSPSSCFLDGFPPPLQPDVARHRLADLICNPSQLLIEYQCGGYRGAHLRGGRDQRPITIGIPALQTQNKFRVQFHVQQILSRAS